MTDAEKQFLSAAADGDTEKMVRLVRQVHVNPNVRGEPGGRTAGCEAALKKKTGTFRAWLKNGGDPYAEDVYRWSPGLYSAALGEREASGMHLPDVETFLVWSAEIDFGHAVEALDYFLQGGMCPAAFALFVSTSPRDEATQSKLSRILRFLSDGTEETIRESIQTVLNMREGLGLALVDRELFFNKLCQKKSPIL